MRRFKVPFFGSAVVAACGAVLLVLHARNALDGDEGVILNGAWNLLHGRALYTDFFEFLAPGSFYLVLAAWKVFGSSFWVAKGVGLAAIAVAAVGIDRITRQLLAGRSPAATPALFAPPLLFCLFSGYLPTINHNAFHLPIAVWSTYFAVRALQAASWRMGAAAGLLCGAGAWFLQHRAALMAAATLVVLCGVAIRSRDGRAQRCAAAYLLGVLAPVAALAIGWPPSVLFENLILFPATRYLEVNEVEPTAFLAATSFTLAAAWLLRKRFDAALALMLLLQAFLLVTTLQRPDLSHVTSALFSLLCLLPLLIQAPAETATLRTLQIWTAAGLVSLVVPLISFTWSNPGLFLADWSRHPALQFVREHCRQSPYLYAGPFAPGLYFETRKLNPTRYAILLPRLHTDAQFAEARSDLERRRPQCVITNYDAVGKFSHTRDNPVDAYVAANYAVVFQGGHRQVWMARSEADRTKPPVAPTPAATLARP